MAQAPVRPDFTGTWKLETNEGIDEFLESEGWPWLKRKAASKAYVTLIITQTDTGIQITEKVSIKGTIVLPEFKFDGTPSEVHSDPNDKDNTTVVAWNEDGDKLIETMTEVKDKIVRTKERYILPNGKMMVIVTNHKGKVMKRTWKKEE